MAGLGRWLFVALALGVVQEKASCPRQQEVSDMAASAIAPGWTVTSGEWGTDIDREESLSVAGPYSIWFKDTTPAADPQIVSGLHPVTEGTWYAAWGRLRADDVTAGNTMLGQLVFYEGDGTTVISSVTFINNAVLGAADTWEIHSAVNFAPTDARWAAWKISKKNNAFNAYVDEVDFHAVPPMFQARRITSAQSINDTTSTDIVFNEARFEYGAAINTSTGVITLKEAGTWLITLVAKLSSLGDGKSAQADIYVNGANFEYAGDLVTNGAAADVRVRATAIIFGVPSGTTLTGRIRHNHGSSRNLPADGETEIRGTLLGRS